MPQFSSFLLLPAPILLPVQVCGLLFTHSSLCHPVSVFVVAWVWGEDIAQLLTISKAEESVCVCVFVWMGGWCYKNDGDICRMR